MTLKSNLWLVILSFVLAFSFWFQTILLKVQVAIIRIPVVVTNLSAGNESDIKLPADAKIRVKGLGYEILKLKFNRINAQIDAQYLAELPDGISVNDYKINIPPSINVEVLGMVNSVNPGAPDVSAKLLQLPILISFADDETRNLFYQRNFHPSFEKIDVRTKGVPTESAVSIKTQVLTMNMLQRDKIKLKLIPPSENYVLLKQSIELNRSTAQLITKVIANVPIRTVRNLSFFPSEITIRIRGHIDIVKNLTPEKIEVTLKNFNTEDRNAPLQVTLPSGIELIDYSPKTVSINGENVSK